MYEMSAKVNVCLVRFGVRTAVIQLSDFDIPFLKFILSKRGKL